MSNPYSSSSYDKNTADQLKWTFWLIFAKIIASCNHDCRLECFLNLRNSLYPYSFYPTWFFRFENVILLVRLEPLFEAIWISYTLFSWHIYNVSYHVFDRSSRNQRIPLLFYVSKCSEFVVDAHICTTFCHRLMYIGPSMSSLFHFFLPFQLKELTECPPFGISS